jgi:hypothetical protein
MNVPQHTITKERWGTFSLAAQCMHIASELTRAESFSRRGDVGRREHALARARELAELSFAASETGGRRRAFRQMSQILQVLLSGEKSGIDVTVADLEQELEPFAVILARERGV